MAKTIAQIKTEAQTIKNATMVGENTAMRVGGAIEDLADYVNEVGGTFASGEDVGDVSLFDEFTDLTGKTDAQKALMLPNGKIVDAIETQIANVSSSFATGEDVGDVSIFDDPSDLTGKTDEQKALMIPSGRLVENTSFIEEVNVMTDVDKTLSTGTISASDAKFWTNENFYGYWYDISAYRGKYLHILTHNTKVNAIAFTTEISSANNSPVYYANGWSNIVNLTANTSYFYQIPSDAVYVFIMTYGNGDRTPQGVDVVEPITDAVEELLTLEPRVDSLEDKIGDERVTENYTFTDDSYIALNVPLESVVSTTPVSLSGWAHSAFIPVLTGDKFRVNGFSGNGPRSWGFVDSSYKLKSVADAATRYDEVDIIAPCDGYLVSNMLVQTDNPNYIDGYYLHKIEGVDVIAEIEKKLVAVSGNNPIGGMKRITLFVLYGQSLSVGADATSPISTSQKYNSLMFNTGAISKRPVSAMTSFVPLVESGYETPLSGTGEMFIEALSQENNFSQYYDEWDDHQLLFVACGAGGTGIETLMTNAYYQYFENAITAAKNICAANGWTLDIPAWGWMQGEDDCKHSMSASDYKTKLLALQNMVCNSVSTITGITERPKCIIYQPSCQNIFVSQNGDYDFNYDHMGVPTAFMELLRDNSEFIASIPTYIFDPANSGGVWVHLNEQSYKLLGAFQGYALKRWMIDGERNQGVIPISVSVSGTTITIKYNVPCPPLRIDTDYVKVAPNYGYNVIKSDNTELISNVSVFNDTITIECTESPVGAKLRYGMNGTKHHFHDTIGGVTYDYWSGAGREIGARGNIRDCQGNYVFKNILGVKYPLHNWAYTFEKVL